MSNETETSNDITVTSDTVKNAFITIKVNDQIKACTDQELSTYEDNLKKSNKRHNLMLSKYKAMTGTEFGKSLKTQFVENGIFTEDKFNSYLAPRFDTKTGDKLKDREVFNLKQFVAIKNSESGSDLLRSYGRNSRIAPVLALDKELEELEIELEKCTNLPTYKSVHQKVKDTVALQSKLLKSLQSDKELMKNSKEAQRIENEVNKIAFRRMTFEHRFSTSLINLKLLAIEGEQHKRLESANDAISDRKTDMRATFQKMLG